MISDLCIYGYVDYKNLELLLPKIFSSFIMYCIQDSHIVDVNQALLC